MKTKAILILSIMHLAFWLNAQTADPKSGILCKAYLAANINHYSQFFTDLKKNDQTKKTKQIISSIDSITANDNSKSKVIAFCNDPLVGNYVPTYSELNSTFLHLQGEYNKLLYCHDTAKLVDYTITGTGKGALPLGGTSWQNCIITGLTDFLLSRAKEEVVISFIDDINKIIENDKTKIIKNLFPSFTFFVANSSSYDFQSFIPLLKEAALKDYHDILKNISAHPELIPENNTCFSAYTPLLLNSIINVTEGGDPIQILSNFKNTNSNIDTKCNKTVSSSIQFIGILANEYYVYKNSSFQIYDDDLSDIKAFLKIPLHRAYVARFLKEALPVQNIINNDNCNAFPVLDFMKQLSEIDILVHQIKGGQSNPDSLYVQYLNTFMGVVDFTTRLFPEDTTLKSTIKEFHDVIDIQNALIIKNYNKTLIGIVNLLKTNITNNKDECPKILRILSFTAGLASVDKKEDVEVLLKSFADPVGSFREKRLNDKLKLSCSLNSYLGLTYGKEKLISTIKEIDGKTGKYTGCFLPVGIEFSINTTWKPISSVGLFGSILDLGNLASYRLNGNSYDSLTINNNSRITFQNVMNPGAYLTFGITKDKPLSIGFGAEYIPAMRKLESNNLIEDQTLKGWRYSVFVALDLTLFKF